MGRVIALCLLGVCACIQERAPAPAAVADAGPPPPARPVLELEVSFGLLDGGVAQATVDGGTRWIEPAQTVMVETNLPLRNHRIRLFDEADRILESDDRLDERAGHVHYEIALKTALKTGHKYTLTVEPHTGDQLLDEHGNAIDEQRLVFTVVGDKEKAAPQKPARRRRR